MSMSVLSQSRSRIAHPIRTGTVHHALTDRDESRKISPICGRPVPLRRYPLIGGSTTTPARPMTSGVASRTLDMKLAMSRGAVNGRSIPATGCRAIWLTGPGDHPEIAVDAQLNQEPAGSKDAYGARSRVT